MPLRLRHPTKTAAQAVNYRAWATTLRARGNVAEAERLEHRAAQLTEQLRAADRCRHCGRPLEDPTSQARGIGSTCWARGHR